MVAAYPLSSLTIVVPFYNESATVKAVIQAAYDTGTFLTKDLRVIAVHGPSTDDTLAQLHTMQVFYPSLVILDASTSLAGYAVVALGLKAATSEWTFYTDGDGQYDIHDLVKLVDIQKVTGSEVVNGYKTNTSLPKLTRYIHIVYGRCIQKLLKVPLRDPHCNFRLIKTSLLADWTPRATGKAIIQDLLMHLKRKTLRWVEVRVTYQPRVFGKTHYSLTRTARDTVRGIAMFWKYHTT
jgi:glycosyltransferase involved in cell wall biosynthesis